MACVSWIVACDDCEVGRRVRGDYEAHCPDSPVSLRVLQDWDMAKEIFAQVGMRFVAKMQHSL
jgi:hypothetical protein